MNVGVEYWRSATRSHYGRQADILCAAACVRPERANELLAALLGAIHIFPSVGGMSWSLMVMTATANPQGAADALRDAMDLRELVRIKPKRLLLLMVAFGAVRESRLGTLAFKRIVAGGNPWLGWWNIRPDVRTNIQAIKRLIRECQNDSKRQ